MEPKEFCHTFHFENGSSLKVTHNDSEYVGYNHSEDNNVKIFSTSSEEEMELLVTFYPNDTESHLSKSMKTVVINFSKVLFVEME